jgi:hypothetical protein
MDNGLTIDLVGAAPKDYLIIIESFLSNPDNLVTLGYICGGSFIILLLLGITNTIVVYKDESDFIFSLAVIIVPIVTFFALAYLSPEDPPDSYNIFWEDTPHKIISSIGVTLTLLSMLKTLLNCISNNGIILGPIMFLFKMLAAIISICVILGIFQKAFGRERTLRNIILGTIIFGIFAFFIKKLINGDRVELNTA